MEKMEVRRLMLLSQIGEKDLIDTHTLPEDNAFVKMKRKDNRNKY